MRRFECKHCSIQFSPAYRLPKERVLEFCSKRCAAHSKRGTFYRATDLTKAVRDVIRENGRYTALDEIIQALQISSKTPVKFNVSVVSCNRLEGFKRPSKRMFENRVGEALEMKFEVEREVSFDWCVSPRGHPLRYDFNLVGKNILVEADGSQHKPGHPWSSEYYRTCDELKRCRAEENGYVLIRIPYTKRVTPEYVLDHIAEAHKATTRPVMAGVNA